MSSLNYNVLVFNDYLSMCTVVSRCYSDGSFRLANVTRDSSRSVNGLTLTVTGRIEVCANSSHKSLCSHYWDQADAQVFCEYYLGHFYGRRLLGNISKKLIAELDSFYNFFSCSWSPSFTFSVWLQ